MASQPKMVQRALEGNWHKMAAVLLDKAGGGRCVDITLADIMRLDGHVIVATEIFGGPGEPDVLRLQLLTEGEAIARGLS